MGLLDSLSVKTSRRFCLARLERIYEEMGRRNLSRWIVSNRFNVRYLSGFTGDTGWLVVEPDSAVLITDFRFEEQAGQEVHAGVRIVIDKRDVLTAACDALAKVEGRIGFESEALAYAAFEKLAGAVQAELVPVEGLAESLRKIKDSAEIASLARAVEVGDTVFEEIVKEIRTGMTEVDLAARIDFLLRRRSTDVPPFKTIVASGERSSLPHATPTDRVIGKGDLVKMDFGASLDGYCSDLTRTVVMGKASERQREIHQVVLDAQLKAEAGIRAGVKGSEADGLARQHIESRGFGDKFGHSLGHGVGLEVHEEPRLSQKNETPLESGMVTTVEPGIYIPGWGGVRIEDMVVVEDGGCRVLTSATKRLIELGD
jgi:Xaa-Pro aminopeptidase